MKKILFQILKDNKLMNEVSFDYPDGRAEKDIIKDIKSVLTNKEHQTLSPQEVFSFAIGKSWVDIKDIFQYNLIMFHKNKTKPGSDAYKSLGMNKPTFYSAHRKLANKGFRFPDYRMKAPHSTDTQILEPLQGYVKDLVDSSWTAALKQFEEDVFRFLYHRYGYNKVRLSEVLRLGYSAVIGKTKTITDV